MSNSRKGVWALIIVVILVIIVLLLILAAGGTSSLPPTTTQTATTTQTIEANYVCDGGKTIDATYLNATTSTTTGNSVMLSLSDGRQMTLAQTVSADGARYSNGNPQIANGQPGAETFVFWSKGNGAIVQDNGSSTYNNCVTQNA